MKNKKLMSPVRSGTIITSLAIGIMILLAIIPTASRYTIYWSDGEFLCVVGIGFVLVLSSLIALIFSKKRLDI